MPKLLKYFLFACGYLAVLPMASGFIRLVRTPNDFAFYMGWALFFAIVGYVLVLTTKVNDQIKADLEQA